MRQKASKGHCAFENTRFFIKSVIALSNGGLRHEYFMGNSRHLQQKSHWKSPSNLSIYGGGGGGQLQASTSPAKIPASYMDNLVLV